MLWPNLPLPYHILAGDPSTTKPSVSESYLCASKSKKKTIQCDPDGHSTIHPETLHRGISFLYTHMKKNMLHPLIDWNESHWEFLWFPMSDRVVFTLNTHQTCFFHFSQSLSPFCIIKVGIWFVEGSEITKPENIPEVTWPGNFSELISVWSRKKKIQTWPKDFC